MKKKKKILFITHAFPPYSWGGTEVYLYNLTKHLAGAYEIFLMFPSPSRNTTLEVIHKRAWHEIHLPVMYNYFDQIFSPQKIYFSQKNGSLLQKIINDISPQVVHIHHLLGLSLRFLPSIQFPVIFTLHDYWLICPMVNMVDWEYRLCNGPGSRKKCVEITAKVLLENPGKRHWIIAKLLHNSLCFNFLKYSLSSYYYFSQWEKNRNKLLRNLLSSVDIFIAPSYFLRKKLVEYGYPSEKIRVLPHGFYKPFISKNKKPSRNIKLGFVGTLLPHKGLHILLEAVKYLKGKWELHIFGKFEPKRIKYHRYLEQMSSASNIYFWGLEKEKDKIYSHIDVLVFPSICYENYPLAIREAFLWKIPVIASKIGAIQEAFEEGKGALFFTPGDPKDLAQKIQMILDNPDLLRKLKRSIPEPMSMEEHVKKLEEIYDEAMENHLRVRSRRNY